MQMSMFSLEAPPASPSASQDFAKAWLTLGETSPSPSLRLLTSIAPAGFFGRTSPEFYPVRGGADFEAFLGGMGELGYGWAYRVLDAQYFGLAQRRRRVFVAGCARGWAAAAAVLFELESLRGDPAPGREARERFAPSLAARTRGGGGLGTDAECDGALVTHALRAEGFDASEDGTGRGIPLTPWPAEVAPTLNAHFGDKQGLEDQHALAGGGLFVPGALPQCRGAGPTGLGKRDPRGGQ